MNIHQIPAFTQNFSTKFSCCVPELHSNDAVYTITKPESLKKSREIFFQKIALLLFVVVVFLLQDVAA